MSPPTSPRLVRTIAFAAALLSACDDPVADTASKVVDAPTIDSVADSAAVNLAPSSYDAAMGNVLVVPLLVDGALSSSVALLSPGQSPEIPLSDTTGLRERLGDGRMELFARSGKLGERAVTWDDSAPVTAACTAWPAGRWVSSTEDVGASRWLVALPSGRARAIPLDSIESLGSRDSASLAATLARLASALPEDSTTAFRGLPFTVQRAYRTMIVRDSAGTARASEDGFVVGVLVRRIPQEDRPLEERLLVVLSTPGTDTQRWSIAWHERATGREESVIATEPLAALLVGSDAPYTALILGRDDGSGASLAVLERRGNRWRVRWESPVSGC